MKREYSQEDVERILKGEAKIPQSVDERIQKTYRELGLKEDKAATKGRQSVRRRSRKAWVAVAAAAVLTAGLGVTVFAVGQLLKADLVEKEDEPDKLVYEIEVEPVLKEVHQIKVEPTYVPEGYEYQTEPPYGGKWHNFDTGGGMSLIPYNAADLARIEASESYGLFTDIDKEDYVKSVELDGMSVDLFRAESVYEDDGSVIQNAFVFNEEEGYAVQVWVKGVDIAEDEAMKVAEGLKITILDETVPYPTEEELAKITEETKAYAEQKQTGSVDYELHKIGEKMSHPDTEMREHYPFTYKVTDIRIEDSLPLDQYPKENYIDDYDSTVAPLLNEDGTLKTHKRYRNLDGLAEDGQEEAEARFVVVDIEVSNEGNASREVQIGPDLELYTPNGGDDIKKYSHEPASLAFMAVMGDGMPIYQSLQTNSGKGVFLAEIGSGETVKCTLAYVADEDTLDDAYLRFFNLGGKTTRALVKVEE